MMIQRCTNPDFPEYEHYGGRGITVCERWHDFANFLADMGERPSSKYSIDRFPDNNGNYEAENCRWATSREQGRNKRTNRIIEAFGRKQLLCEWAEETGLSPTLITARMGRLGWSIERALSTPANTTNFGRPKRNADVQE